MPGQLIIMFLADGVADGIKTLEMSKKTYFVPYFHDPCLYNLKNEKRIVIPVYKVEI